MRPILAPRLASLPVLLAVLAAACARAPSGRTCAADADCPSGSCQHGVCQAGLALEIAAPADQAVTRGTVAVAVRVGGEAPPAVQLLVDDQRVATLAPPFEYTLDTSALGEGSHTLVAETTLGGRTFRTPERALIVDRTPPAAPAPMTGVTNASNPVLVSGTAAPGATVTVYEGGTALGSGAASPGGVWSVAVTLSEGAHALTATAADAAGNVSQSSLAVTVVVDRTPPAPPAVNGGITNAANPVPISGTGEAGTRVTVYEAGAPIASNVVVGAGGTWSTSAPLADGPHTLTAISMDGAGNASAVSATASLVVDRSAALPPAIAGMTTNAADPVSVTGTAEGGSTVTLYEGGTVLGSGVAATAGGGWSIAVSLSEGPHALTATSTDAAGNVSALSAAATVRVDRTAPAAPAIAGRITNAANPVPVGGTAEAGAALAVHEGATLLGAGFVATAGGTWVGAVPLGEGSHTLTATATDAAGNVSGASAPSTVVVDRSAPAAPVVSAATTNAVNPVPVSGTAEPGATVTVYEGGTALGGGFVAGAGGAWSGAVPLAAGTHALTATATDAAGNVSPLSGEASVVVDRTAPVAPSVASQTTNAANPVAVTGTAEAGASITLYEDGVTLASDVAVSGGGGWSVAVTLAEGTHALTASATDAAGNVSALSSPATVVIDRTLPAAPAVTPQTTNATNPVTLGGAAEPGATVVVSEGGTVLVPGVVASPGGTWSAAVSLAEGTHTLTATATDAAGNVSPLSGPADVVVDRSPPYVALPTVPVDGATGVWSRSPIVVTFSERILPGTLTAQSVTVRADGVDVALTAPPSASLSADGRTLTLTPNPAALPAVPSTVVATLTSAITDVAGNALAPTTWSWSLPAWVAPAPTLNPNADGSSPYTSVLGPDASIRVVASRSPPRQLASWATSGGAWVFTGNPDPTGLFSIADYGLGADATGRMTVGFVSSGKVRVTQQSAVGSTTWTTLSTGLNLNAANAASAVRVAVDSQKQPVVAWIEAGTVYAKRWDGASWSQVGAGIATTTGVYALAIAPGDQVGIAVEGGVYVDGTRRSGYNIDTSTAVALVFDDASTPFVAYVPSGTTTVQVVRPGNPPASWYTPLGSALGTSASAPSLIYRASGAAGEHLLVAYGESSGSASVQVLGWSGSAWRSIASDIGTPAASFYKPLQLLVNAAGIVGLTWSENQWPAAQLTPRLYNR